MLFAILYDSYARENEIIIPNAVEKNGKTSRNSRETIDWEYSRNSISFSVT